MPDRDPPPRDPPDERPWLPVVLGLLMLGLFGLAVGREALVLPRNRADGCVPPILMFGLGCAPDAMAARLTGGRCEPLKCPALLRRVFLYEDMSRDVTPRFTAMLVRPQLLFT
jgi:hypothetical protein